MISPFNLRTAFKTYFTIYSSFLLVGLVFLIYMIFSGFHGDVGPYYTFLLYLIGSVITSLISMAIYIIICYLLSIRGRLSLNMLFIGLVIIGIIQIIVWLYGNMLFEKNLLAGHSFIEFGFYKNEEFLLIMHSIFYFVVGTCIKLIK